MKSAKDLNEEILKINKKQNGLRSDNHYLRYAYAIRIETLQWVLRGDL